MAKKEELKQAAVEQKKVETGMQKKYRNTFTAPEGWDVFKHLLGRLGYFGTIETDEERILHNFANELILDVMGTQGTDAIEAQMRGVLEYAKRK